MRKLKFNLKIKLEGLYGTFFLMNRVVVCPQISTCGSLSDTCTTDCTKYEAPVYLLDSSVESGVIWLAARVYF